MRKARVKDFRALDTAVSSKVLNRIAEGGEQRADS